MKDLIADIHRYCGYFEPFSTGFGVDFKIRLPFSKGRDEHPYWLIEKIEYIFSIYKEVRKEVSK